MAKLARNTASAHTRNASLGTAVTLTIPTDADILFIQAETQNVRITFDGTTPTATVGFLLTAGYDPYPFIISSLMTIKIIEVTSGGVVNYQFFQ